ncbi:MAG: hypothetical protein BRD30_10710 [Bacteroidetes bacterium QH_2_63_10]|nr:MAG: hypothetical protein BRD30_10710 [Bacteroidetes bacterium QH_2_63_10]
MSSVPVRLLLFVVGVVVFGAFLGGCESSGPPPSDAPPPPSHLDSLSTAAAPPPAPGTPSKLVRSQTLYVPAYSHIYYRNAQRSINLTTTLSLRNTSPETPIVLSTIDYYDSNGDRVQVYLDTPRTLAPLASTYVVIEGNDLQGGVGANFLVRWHAGAPVPPPVVETVMITTASTQGISFRSPARVLRENRASIPDTLSDREPQR